MEMLFWIVSGVIALLFCLDYWYYRSLIKSRYEWLYVVSQTEWWDRRMLRALMDERLRSHYFASSYFLGKNLHSIGDLEDLVEEGMLEVKEQTRFVYEHEVNTDCYRLTPHGKAKRDTLYRTRLSPQLVSSPT